jgi:hypothetical protein
MNEYLNTQVGMGISEPEFENGPKSVFERLRKY